MFITYKDVRRLDPEKSVNKPYENVSCQVRIQKFFQGQGHEILTFLNVFFPAELI